MGFFTYYTKVKKISKSLTATAYFTPSEIVSAIVNLLEAKKNLTPKEYFYVSVVFDKFNNSKNKLLLNQESFLDLCNDIIAHFDLIAPYYMFCGNQNLQVEQQTEIYKVRYRQQAKILLNDGKIFQEEWIQLHQKFIEEFK